MRWTRRFAAVALDLSLVMLAWGLSFWLRFNLEPPEQYLEVAIQGAGLCVIAYAAALAVTDTWRPVWSYVGLPELRRLVLGIALGGVFTAAAGLALRLPQFPRSVLLMQPLLALVLLGAARVAKRTLVERRTSHGGGRRVVVGGTLQDAVGALRALEGSPQGVPVGIVSPVAAEVGRSIQDVPVLAGLDDMALACARVDAQTAIVASAPGSEERRQALLGATDAGIPLLALPRPDEWLRAQGTGPRKVELEDLLGRAPGQLDVAGLSDLLSGQTVLVTGAGGSIGSELCRQIARFGAARLVCVDVSEFAIYQLEQELRASHPQLQALYYTGNVRELERLAAIAQRHRPAVVFHAAA